MIDYGIDIMKWKPVEDKYNTLLKQCISGSVLCGVGAQWSSGVTLKSTVLFSFSLIILEKSGRSYWLKRTSNAKHLIQKTNV